jgi:hypothetical protein
MECFDFLKGWARWVLAVQELRHLGCVGPVWLEAIRQDQVRYSIRPDQVRYCGPALRDVYCAVYQCGSAGQMGSMAFVLTMGRGWCKAATLPLHINAFEYIHIQNRFTLPAR